MEPISSSTAVRTLPRRKGIAAGVALGVRHVLEEPVEGAESALGGGVQLDRLTVLGEVR